MWEIDNRPESDWIFIGDDVCQIHKKSWNAVGHAHLIAAAPALLDALESVATWLISPDLSQETIDGMRSEARAAISKAKVGTA